MSWVPDPYASGMGHGEFRLDFTNAGAVPCVLEGYPGLVAIDADGRELGDPGEPNTYLPADPVEVAPGGVVTVNVRFTRPGLYDCPVITAAGLRASMPGTGGQIVTDAPIEACAEHVGSLFSIGPFTQPG